MADGFHRLEDLVHLCHAVGQNVLGVAICISLVPRFLEHLLEAPLFHEYLVKLLFCMRQLGPLDQNVRFQAVEVHYLVLPLGPEVRCEYRRLFNIFAGRCSDRYLECVVSLIQSV